ncbi:MAG: hypothetical protein AB7F35_12055 [Acetobacteraceae bacterium]
MTVPLHMAAERLAAILARENDRLRATDLTAAVALVPEKRAATENLATALAAASATPPDPTRVILRQVQALGAENQTLLERAMAVQRQVIEIIRGALPKAAAAPRYGALGSLTAERTVTAYALTARA